MPAIHPADALWLAVNALGYVPSTPEEKIYNDAIGDALTVIESLGGMDPMERQSINDAASAELERRIADLVNFQYARPAMAFSEAAE